MVSCCPQHLVTLRVCDLEQGLQDFPQHVDVIFCVQDFLEPGQCARTAQFAEDIDGHSSVLANRVIESQQQFVLIRQL
jgi:hypothetical protein